MIRARFIVTALALTALLSVSPSNAADPGRGVVVNSHEFLLGEIHTAAYAYYVAAWVGGGPDDPGSARVVIQRFEWRDAIWTTEDVVIDEMSLHLTHDAGITTIRFAADLPVTGRFDVVLSSARMRPMQWVAAGMAPVFAGESAAETTYGPGQIAGGAPGLLVDGKWGLRGHGFVIAGRP